MKTMVLGVLLLAVVVCGVAAQGPLGDNPLGASPAVPMPSTPQPRTPSGYPSGGYRAGVDMPAGPRGEAASAIRAGAAGDLIALAENVGQRYQQVVVIDAKQKVISVYHVDLTTGQIALRSVRAIQWDLRMSDFNGKTPLPREIQAMSEQR